MKTLSLLGVLLALLGGGQRLAYLPIPGVTPGAVNPFLTRDVICAKEFRTGKFRRVPQSMKNRVYTRYGIPQTERKNVEIDHLISIELGGSNEFSNLWAEPWTLCVAGRDMGAHTKDRVENAAHKAVCSGKITLAEAQAQIRTDWTKLYERLIGPLPECK